MLLGHLKSNGNQDNTKDFPEGDGYLWRNLSGNPVGRMQDEVNDYQIDQDAGENAVIVVVCLQRNDRRQGTRTGKDGERNGDDAAGISGFLVVSEEPDAQGHFHSDKENDEGTRQGERGDFQAEDAQNSGPEEQKGKHDNCSCTRGL